MVQDSQIVFAKAVEENVRAYTGMIPFSSGPSIRVDGFVSSATIATRAGAIELLFGPPEYHVELFVRDSATERRWRFADVVQLSGVRSWLEVNPFGGEPGDQVRNEVSYFFRLLHECLLVSPELRDVF